jgi:hypothetical protein
MVEQETSTPYIQLDYRRDGSIVVTPEDQDRFVMSMQEAVVACKDASQVLRYSRQFSQGLLPKLTTWLQDRRASVRKAFLTVRDGGLLLVVVRKESVYDAAFTDALTDLDVEIARDSSLDLILLDVLALPDVSDEGARSFLSPSRHREIASAD